MDNLKFRITGLRAKERLDRSANQDIIDLPYSTYKPNLSQYANRDDALERLVHQYLEPWLPISATASTGRITQSMLAAMEYSYKGGSVRIRISHGRIYYRKLVYWKQTYRTQRMAWYLAFLRDLLDTGYLDKDLHTDFVLYLGDGPKVAADTFTSDAGFPLFSLRTSQVHLDIPVPDPTAFGSNGNYLWPDEARAIPWSQRIPKAVFRGRGSCLKMQADNWHFCNRVKAAQLASPLLDIGIIEWNQLYGSAKTLFDAPSKQDIESSTNVSLKPPLDYHAQAKYQMIIDLDGGLGSSRRPGILASGSLLLAQDSPWYVHWEPLAKPGREYLPISRTLTDLSDVVERAVDPANQEKIRAVSENGKRFADKFTSLPSARKYMRILLIEYSKLLELFVANEPIKLDYCQRPGNSEIENGPIGCSKSWLEYNGHLPLSISNDNQVK